MTSGTTVSIDFERLKASLLQMARIGATPAGGVTRLALSEADREARDLFAAWASEAGLAVRVDDMGTQYARYEGTDPALAPVLVGSHLDSVPLGGKFDGPLGVLTGLEVVRALHDHGVRPTRGVEVELLQDVPPTRFDPRIVGLIEQQAGALGVPCRRLVAGAGHDAKYMSEIAPAAMLFVRTVGGKSHCETEDVHWPDVEVAANVLLRSVLALAGEP